MRIKIAGAQIPVTSNIKLNLEAIDRGIEFAKREKAEILLTPEGSLSGYTHDFDKEAAVMGLEKLRAKARECGVGLALGTCFFEPSFGARNENQDKKCYNQIRFYKPNGDYLGFYSKTLTCGTLTNPSVGEINHYAVSELRTFAWDGITIGGLVCNDMWANPCCTPIPDPHLSQKLSDMGAGIIFHAVNTGRSDSEWGNEVEQKYHEANLRMRARAGKIWIVTVDNCYPLDMDCGSRSGVIDPNGSWVCRIPSKGEQFFAHTIEI